MTRLSLPERPPALWPKFSSPIRSTAVTARVGRVLGIFFAICFVTGMLSHYQYEPWLWLPEPVSPAWLYRVTQGTHVITGIAIIPLLLVKLWSVYPKLFSWPPVKSAKNSLERASVALLVSSAIVEVTTGFFNTLNWYPWSWDFVPVHRFLGYVVIGSILLHIAIKLSDIKYGLGAKVTEGDVLTEAGWEDNPDAYSNNDSTHVAPPEPEGVSRRGVILAGGVGVGVIVATTVGQTVTPLGDVGLFAIRRKKDASQLGVPVNRTAEQAKVLYANRSADWRLTVIGKTTRTFDLSQLLTMPNVEADISIACVEGWSAGAHWRGVKLVDFITMVGGDEDSRVKVSSIEPKGSFNYSFVDGPEVSEALLATHLNGQPLTDDHGYPLRLIAPGRAGVLNTKWLTKVEVL